MWLVSIVWILFGIYVVGVFVTTHIMYSRMKSAGVFDRHIRHGDKIEAEERSQGVTVNSKYEFDFDTREEEFVINNHPYAWCLVQYGLLWFWASTVYSTEINGLGLWISQKQITVIIVILVVIGVLISY